MAKARLHLHIPNLYVGGIERWALSILNGVPEVDWTISTPDSALSHQSGIDDFARFKLVAEEDIPTDCDLVLATWGLARDLSTPTVAVAHSAFRKYAEMMQSFRYDFAVAVAASARVAFPSGAAVTTIYNGVELSRLQPRRSRRATRDRLGISADAVVIGYVGRWGYQKNPLSAALAASQIPGAVALYIGPKSEDPGLLEAATGIADCRFVTPEQVDGIADLYAAMDVCVFASRSEGFGLAIAEAWYCKAPVVATRVGVAAEHPDFITPLPPEPGAADLKAAAEAAMSDAGAAKLAGARARVIGYYNSERMVDDWRSYLNLRLPGLNLPHKALCDVGSLGDGVVAV